MAASVNLLQEKTWTGEFFAPDDYGSRFSGRLGYAPEAGVRLDYRVTGLAEPRAHSLLHAVLHTGEAATLLGRFSLPAQRMPSLQRGYLTHAGTVGFPCLLVGELVPVDAGWPMVAFTLTQMQEFFFPGGYKDWQRFQHDPLVQVWLDGCEIEVVPRGQFGLAAPDLSAHFHSSNPAYLERLGACMEEVQQAFPDDWLMLKQDFRYEVVIRYDTPRSCEALYADIERLANLFAILMYRPVYPQWIETRRPEPGQITGRCTLYPSMLVDPRTLSLFQRPASFFSLPITMNEFRGQCGLARPRVLAG